MADCTCLLKYRISYYVSQKLRSILEKINHTFEIVMIMKKRIQVFANIAHSYNSNMKYYP